MPMIVMKCHAWFTPTHVGTMLEIATCSCHPTVHPHTRGDNFVDLPAIHAAPGHPHTRGDNNTRRGELVTINGSPPHTWGQLRVRVIPGNGVRFTPTHVGTISRNWLYQMLITVHPHTRGDNALRGHGRGAGGGSPPHTWGQ